MAFDINLDGQKEAEKKPETEEVKPRLSFPRRLPKLSSFGSKNEVKTTDEILEKQKKVEEKRKEKLEEKKQKARKFMDKFSKSTESIDPPNEIEVNSGEEEPKSSGESTTKAMVSSVTEQTTTVVNSVVVSDGAEWRRRILVEFWSNLQTNSVNKHSLTTIAKYCLLSKPIFIIAVDCSGLLLNN